MMLTGLQSFLKSLPLDGTPGKSQSVDSETIQPISFGEVLKLKEKQLQQAQEVSASSIAAAFAALQTSALGISLPIPNVETSETSVQTEVSKPSQSGLAQLTTNPIETSDSSVAPQALTARFNATESADPTSQPVSNTEGENRASHVLSQTELPEIRSTQKTSAPTSSVAAATSTTPEIVDSFTDLNANVRATVPATKRETSSANDKKSDFVATPASIASENTPAQPGVDNRIPITTKIEVPQPVINAETALKPEHKSGITATAQPALQTKKSAVNYVEPGIKASKVVSQSNTTVTKIDEESKPKTNNAPALNSDKRETLPVQNSPIVMESNQGTNDIQSQQFESSAVVQEQQSPLSTSEVSSFSQLAPGKNANTEAVANKLTFSSSEPEFIQTIAEQSTPTFETITAGINTAEATSFEPTPFEDLGTLDQSAHTSTDYSSAPQVASRIVESRDSDSSVPAAEIPSSFAPTTGETENVAAQPQVDKQTLNTTQSLPETTVVSPETSKAEIPIGEPARTIPQQSMKVAPANVRATTTVPENETSKSVDDLNEQGESETLADPSTTEETFTAESHQPQSHTAKIQNEQTLIEPSAEKLEFDETTQSELTPVSDQLSFAPAETDPVVSGAQTQTDGETVDEMSSSVLSSESNERMTPKAETSELGTQAFISHDNTLEMISEPEVRNEFINISSQRIEQSKPTLTSPVETFSNVQAPQPVSIAVNVVDEKHGTASSNTVTASDPEVIDLEPSKPSTPPETEVSSAFDANPTSEMHVASKVTSSEPQPSILVPPEQNISHELESTTDTRATFDAIAPTAVSEPQTDTIPSTPKGKEEVRQSKTVTYPSHYETYEDNSAETTKDIPLDSISQASTTVTHDTEDADTNSILHIATEVSAPIDGEIVEPSEFTRYEVPTTNMVKVAEDDSQLSMRQSSQTITVDANRNVKAEVSQATSELPTLKSNSTGHVAAQDVYSKIASDIRNQPADNTTNVSSKETANTLAEPNDLMTSLDTSVVNESNRSETNSPAPKSKPQFAAEPSVAPNIVDLETLSSNATQSINIIPNNSFEQVALEVGEPVPQTVSEVQPSIITASYDEISTVGEDILSTSQPASQSQEIETPKVIFSDFQELRTETAETAQINVQQTNVETAEAKKKPQQSTSIEMPSDFVAAKPAITLTEASIETEPEMKLVADAVAFSHIEQNSSQTETTATSEKLVPQPEKVQTETNTPAAEVDTLETKSQIPSVSKDLPLTANIGTESEYTKEPPATQFQVSKTVTNTPVVSENQVTEPTTTTAAHITEVAEPAERTETSAIFIGEKKPVVMAQSELETSKEATISNTNVTLESEKAEIPLDISVPEIATQPSDSNVSTIKMDMSETVSHTQQNKNAVTSQIVDAQPEQVPLQTETIVDNEEINPNAEANFVEEITLLQAETKVSAEKVNLPRNEKTTFESVKKQKIENIKEPETIAQTVNESNAQSAEPVTDKTVESETNDFVHATITPSNQSVLETIENAETAVDISTETNPVESQPEPELPKTETTKNSPHTQNVEINQVKTSQLEQVTTPIETASNDKKIASDFEKVETQLKRSAHVSAATSSVPEVFAENADLRKTEKVAPNVETSKVQTVEHKNDEWQIQVDAAVNLSDQVATEQVDSQRIAVEVKPIESEVASAEPKGKPNTPHTSPVTKVADIAGETSMPVVSGNDQVIPVSSKSNIAQGLKEESIAKQPAKDEEAPPVEKQPRLNQTPEAAMPVNGPEREAVELNRNVPSPQVNTHATEVVQQVIRHIDSNLKSGPASMHLQLNPKELGTIDIQMVSNSQGVHVTFVAEQASTSKLLETQLPQLRESLMDSGVQLSGLDISQHHQSGQKGETFEQNTNFARTSQRDLPQGENKAQETSGAERRYGQSSDIDYLI